MAKKAKAEADDDAAAADEQAGAEDGGEKAKKAKKAKRPRTLGPKTVAKPCLIGAALLTLLGGVLPR